MRRRWLALSLMSVAVAGSLGAPGELGLVGLLLPLVALLLGPRLKLGASAELAATFLAALVGILAVRLWLPEPYKHGIRELSERELLFLVPLLMTAGLRALLRDPRFGVRVSVVLGVLALTAAGGAQTGPAFWGLAALFCVLALAAMAAEDPGRREGWHVTRQSAVALALSALLVLGLASSSHQLAPRLHAAVLAKIQQRLQANRVGFSSTLELGDMANLLEDERVVLRVRGPDIPNLLRGVVFTEYYDGRWFSTRKAALEVSLATGLEGTQDHVGANELEHVGRPERYFLPGDTSQINPSSGGYSRDEFRIVYPPEDSFAKRVWFRRHEGAQRQPPGTSELRIPAELQAELTALVAAWGANHGSASQRLARLEQRLGSYRYNLRSERATSEDPVLDFLRHRPEGHCEYFASAMALLARSAGVPTRLVSGYRVAERSPFGYHIVRRQHAHSWVEAWLDEHWVTFDPTPADPLASVGANTPLLPALLDALRTGWAATDDWLAKRTSFELSLGLLVLGALLVVVRRLRARRSQRSLPTQDQPLPGFLALDRSLERRGLGRAPEETLQQFSARVLGTSLLPREQRERVALALGDYALLRYGGQGDSQALDRALKELARGL